MRLFWALSLAGLVLTGATVAAPVLRNYVAAIANDSIITRQQVEDYTRKAVDVLRRTYTGQPDVLKQKLEEAYEEGLQQLLERELILHDFKQSGGVLPERVIDDEIKRIIRQRFGDRVTLTKTLQADGVTLEDYRQRLREDIIVSYMTQHNISSAILISPAKIEAYYKEHLDKYKMEEQAKLRMIVLGQASGVTADDIKQLAFEVLAKMRTGASFAEMASIYSEGSQRRENGDWGWVEQSKLLLKGLSEIAFTLQKGELSNLIGRATDPSGGYWIFRYDRDGRLLLARKFTAEDQFVEEQDFSQKTDAPLPATPSEFYIMLVEDRRPARVKDLEEVRGEIEKDLQVQERERLRRKWIDRLKAKAFVRYF